MKKMLYSTMLLVTLMGAYQTMQARYDDHLVAKGALTPRSEHERKSSQEKLNDLHSKAKEYQRLVEQKGESLSPTDYNAVRMAHEAIKRVQVGLQEQVDPRNRKSGEATKEIYMPNATRAEKAAVKMRNGTAITEQLVAKAPVSALNSNVNDKVHRATVILERNIAAHNKKGSV